MKPLNVYKLCGFLLVLLPCSALAQPTIVFASGTGPVGNGYATANQVVTFQQNALNPTTGTYIPETPTVTVTFAISNQQYVLPATQNPSGADVVFGANVNAAGKTPSSMALYTLMNTISNPQNPQFSSTQFNPGAGMAVTSNYAVELFTSAMGLYNANAVTSGTYYMADLTITFSAPITNPVLHIVGLGGTYGALGMTTQLTLVTGGVTLTRLSGSPEFSVTGGTQIVNTAATPTATTGAGAASGSVLVNGNSVTTLHFQLYLRGDGKAPTWSAANEHTGDAWLIGVSGLNTFITLPVGTTSFTAEPHQHSVGLQWTTETRQNAGYFAIQRSQNGADWTTIGQVAAAANASTSLQYEFTDNHPASGANYYRLQENDNNGGSVYSPVRNVDFSGSDIAIGWYPNPVHDRLTITGTSTIRSATLTTIDGRTLQVFDEPTLQQPIDLSRYPFGIYFLVLRTTDGNAQVAKIERN